MHKNQILHLTTADQNSTKTDSFDSLFRMLDFTCDIVKFGNIICQRSWAVYEQTNESTVLAKRCAQTLDNTELICSQS